MNAACALVAGVESEVERATLAAATENHSAISQAKNRPVVV